MSPKKRNSAARYRPLILLSASVFIILVFLITLIFRSCGKDEESGEDTDINTDTENIVSDTADEDNGDLIYIPVGRDTEADNKNAVPSPSELTKEDLDAAKLVITQDLGAEYIEKFYFLCDSPIYGLKTLGMLSGGIETDRVITGLSASFSLLSGSDALVYDSSSDSVVTVTEKLGSISPEYLLISVGADDIKNHEALSYADFKSAYCELLTAVKKAANKTTVICMPILPGSAGNGLSIYDAEKYNTYIHEAAAECGAYYIDIASAFASSGGYLRIDCDGGDSRLNTTGIKRLLELLRSYTIPDLTQ